MHLKSGKFSLLLKKIRPEHILLLMLLAISAVFMLHNLGKFAANLHFINNYLPLKK